MMDGWYTYSIPIHRVLVCSRCASLVITGDGVIAAVSVPGIYHGELWEAKRAGWRAFHWGEAAPPQGSPIYWLCPRHAGEPYPGSDERTRYIT